MTRRLLFMLSMIGLCLMMNLSYGDTTNMTLLAGVAKTGLNPRIGTDQVGFLSRTHPAIGVLDENQIKVIVLSDGSTKIAILSADILGFDGKDVADMRRGIQQKSDIQYIFFAGTHTHSGPAVCDLIGCGTINPDYHKEFKERIVNTVLQANQSLIPVKIGIGQGNVVIGKNRRKEGGFKDAELNLFRLDKLDGSPFCILMNYACHPVTLGGNNRQFSRDFPGVTQDFLEQQLHCPVLYFTGAIGDINPISGGTIAETKRLGTIVGAEALKTALLTATHEKEVTLSFKTSIVNFPIQQPNTTEIEQIISTSQPGKLQDAMKLWKQKSESMRNITSIPGEIAIVHIGEITLVGMSGEVFSETGWQIKSMLKPNPVFVIGYANGNIGYLPTKAAVAEGGYEVKDAYRYYGQPGPFTGEVEGLIYKTVETLK